MTATRTACRKCGAHLRQNEEVKDQFEAEKCAPCREGARGDLPAPTIASDPLDQIIFGTKEWEVNVIEDEKQRQDLSKRSKALPAPMCKCERSAPMQDVDSGLTCLTCGKACS